VTTHCNQLLCTRTERERESRLHERRCLVAASKGGRSPSSGFPNYIRPQLPASHCNSSQLLNLSSSLTDWLIDWLTQSLTTQLNWLTPLTVIKCLAYNISAWTAQKTLFLCCCQQRLLSSCLFCGHCLATGLHATVCMINVSCSCAYFIKHLTMKMYMYNIYKKDGFVR
jgi:hypothetical protein